MNRKLVLALVLTLLVGMLSVAFNVHMVKANGTIYIRADGSIDPPTAPISSTDKVTYRLTGNVVNQSLVVEKNNIVIDGEDYAIQGYFDSYARYFPLHFGVNVTAGTGVIVKNLVIKQFSRGVTLSNSSKIRISKATIENCTYGIYVADNSDSNEISQNSLTGGSAADTGISVDRGSTGNNISENYVAGFDYGFHVTSDENSLTRNTIRHNIVHGQHGFGIFVDSDRCEISYNNVGDNTIGMLIGGKNNLVSENYVDANGEGIHLGTDACYNLVTRNNITRQSITGIWLYQCCNNTIRENEIASNAYGVKNYYASNNSIYHNNFVDNTVQVSYTRNEPDFWDNGYPSGGNYWSDLKGTDSNGDGIADSVYIVDVDHQDRYPLMNQYPIPEFPSFPILPLFMIVMLLAVITYKKKAKLSRATCVS